MLCKRLGAVATIAMLFFTVAASAAAPSHPVPILLSTDIGTDIDDAFALALILDSPAQLDLRAVTTVSGDTEARARLAAKMLWVDGRKNVPVAAGVPGRKMPIAQTRWADGFTSPELLREPAVQLMKREVDAADGSLVIVSIGPLTEVARLIREYPAEKKKIRRIVLMGGSIAHGYSPGSGPTAEGNIASDPQAAQVVFSSGIPILMAPLDVTARLQLETPDRKKIFSEDTPLTNALKAIYLLWGQPTPTLHDPMAVSLLLDPGLCSFKRLAIRVTARGMTVVEKNMPPNATVALETNPKQFIAFYVARVTSMAADYGSSHGRAARGVARLARGISFRARRRAAVKPASCLAEVEMPGFLAGSPALTR